MMRLILSLVLLAAWTADAAAKPKKPKPPPKPHIQRPK